MALKLKLLRFIIMSLSADFVKRLDEAYHSVGAYDADILYIYTDLRSFGTHAANYPSKNEFCKAVVSPLLNADKTIVLTTFTYTSEGIFNVNGTPTKLGAMNKWILDQPDHVRSEHPIFSYAALGPAAQFLKGIGKSAFGYDSVFHRLRGKRAAFLHIGRPVSLGNTALHHIEHLCGATYRTHKAFRTEVFRGEQYIGTDYTAFLRRRDVPEESFEFDFSRPAAALAGKGLIRQVGFDQELSNISFYWYDDTIDFLADMFNNNQRIFIKSDYICY